MGDIANNGDNVSVHYRGTLEDGTEFDSSYTRGQTLNFEIGDGRMIKAFDTAVTGMTVGETKTVMLESKEAYGELNPEAVRNFDRSAFPENFNFEIGSFVEAKSEEGHTMPARIAGVEGDQVMVDFNHPLAGKNLNFEIHLMRVEKK